MQKGQKNDSGNARPPYLTQLTHTLILLWNKNMTGNSLS